MDVFISYSSKDSKEARQLRSVLEENGISCWMAPESIPIGSDYAAEIEGAISTCTVFVLLLSKNSQDSIWVPKELDRALNHKRFIAPVSNDDCDLTPAFDFRLTNVQRYHIYTDISDSLNTFVNTIKAVLGQRVDHDAPASKDKSPTRQLSTNTEKPEKANRAQPNEKAKEHGGNQVPGDSKLDRRRDSINPDGQTTVKNADHPNRSQQVNEKTALTNTSAAPINKQKHRLFAKLFQRTEPNPIASTDKPSNENTISESPVEEAVFEEKTFYEKVHKLTSGLLYTGLEYYDLISEKQFDIVNQPELYDHVTAQILHQATTSFSGLRHTYSRAFWTWASNYLDNPFDNSNEFEFNILQSYFKDIEATDEEISFVLDFKKGLEAIVKINLTNLKSSKNDSREYEKYVQIAEMSFSGNRIIEPNISFSINCFYKALSLTSIPEQQSMICYRLAHIYLGAKGKDKDPQFQIDKVNKKIYPYPSKKVFLAKAIYYLLQSMEHDAPNYYSMRSFATVCDFYCSLSALELAFYRFTYEAAKLYGYEAKNLESKNEIDFERIASYIQPGLIILASSLELPDQEVDKDVKADGTQVDVRNDLSIQDAIRHNEEIITG